MEKIAGFPFYPLEMTKTGAVSSKPEQAAVVAAVNADGPDRITDLFVVSHGWNNDVDEARGLYNDLFKSVAKLLTGPRALPAGRRIAILGIFWPSKKFADEDLIPAGGAASIGGATGAGGGGVTSAAVKAKLDRLKGTFDKPDAAMLKKARALVDKLEASPEAQRQFVDLIRSVLPKPTDPRDDASDQFFKRSGDVILKALSAPIAAKPKLTAGQGGALGLNAKGGAAGLGDVFNGIQAAAWRLLNYATFYQMKERAGVVGAGVNAVVKTIRDARPDLKMHFVGHSFGARLVTAAVAGTASVKPASLTLLQGAFSHNGFTERFDGKKNGFFRNVISENRINGPIVATHTVIDRAVGLAYPIAVRLSGDQSLALGDENDTYGGLGRNGAVKMKPTEFVRLTLLPETQSYAFTPRKVHNLRADAFVTEHNDVAGLQCANAMLAAAGM